MPNSLRSRLKNLVHNGVLTQKDLDRIVIMPVDGTGDLISRQAVIDAMYSLCGDGTLKENEWRDNPHIDSIIDALNDLPSVSTEKTRWIPVSERLPELNKPLLVTAYHRVCYAHMISKSGNYGYPVFRLHGLKDSDRGWVQETISHEPYSKGRIDAWMYIDIPQPYKAESEDKCKNCKYYRNPDYTRCHECEAEREDKE